MMAGDFTKEEDPYFQFEDALMRWGTSFAALGVDFRGSTLELDLLERRGKYDNGFCRWPTLVQFRGNKRIPGSANFTCNLIPGQVGAGAEALDTLFHEAGHAAHYLNSEETEVCLNTEHPPSSTAWAETQSMFMDSINGSIEWRTRYAQNADGNLYPFELFERKVRKLEALRPLYMMGIMFVADFERNIYEAQKLTASFVKKTAQEIYTKYFDRSVPSYYVLTVPHLYAWESACSYHGYGLAELAVQQWREYFYKKYEYIVDNKHVVKEMYKVWRLAARKTFKEFVHLATGTKLSPNAYLKGATRSTDALLRLAKKRIKRLQRVPRWDKPIDLNATIKMVHGKKTIATNAQNFEDMTNKYTTWLKKQT